MGQDAIARHLRVTGRVQGVFFRDSTRREAARVGVAGWVRNCPDGTVEVWLEGRPQPVADVERWIRGGGPPAAAVDEVQVAEVDPEGFGEFRVRG